MKITAMRIVQSNEADKVLLVSDLLEGAWPYKDFVVFSTTVAKGSGINWAAHNFPELVPEIISTRF